VRESLGTGGRVGRREARAARVGITPSAGPVLAPCLCEAFAAAAPSVGVTVGELWLQAPCAAVDYRCCDHLRPGRVCALQRDHRGWLQKVEFDITQGQKGRQSENVRVIS
jgi:hypothetical protein